MFDILMTAKIPITIFKAFDIIFRDIVKLFFSFRLNVNIVLLVRDPRAILQSRKHREWCPGYPDCDQPNWLCDDMVSDYNSAVKLMQHYPTRFRYV